MAKSLQGVRAAAGVVGSSLLVVRAAAEGVGGHLARVVKVEEISAAAARAAASRAAAEREMVGSMEGEASSRR